MIVVVTAALGTTETPPPPAFPHPYIRYVCATDRECIPGWETVRVRSNEMPRMSARDVKLTAARAYDDAEFVVWVDASFDWLASPATLPRGAAWDIYAFAHPDRHRIHDEAAECVRLGLAPAAAVARQMADYQAAGFDTAEQPQVALTTTGLLAFRPTKAVRDFFALWRDHVTVYTLRDQLSIDYCAWKCGIRIGYLPGHYRDNAFVFYNRARHRARRAA